MSLECLSCRFVRSMRTCMTPQVLLVDCVFNSSTHTATAISSFFAVNQGRLLLPGYSSPRTLSEPQQGLLNLLQSSLQLCCDLLDLKYLSAPLLQLFRSSRSPRTAASTFTLLANNAACYYLGSLPATLSFTRTTVEPFDSSVRTHSAANFWIFVSFSSTAAS